MKYIAFLQPRMLAVLALGFASGLPLALTASTLGVWLSEAGVDKTAIGLFAAVGTPYALKFLWAPLVDGMPIPGFCRSLGRRRGWLLFTQSALMASLLLLGFSDPVANPWFTALAAFIVAVCSATQDIVIDAYRVELLPEREQGAGAAMVVLGYRFGMIAASAGALFMATEYGWQATYAAMAALLLVGTLAAMLVGEPVRSRQLAVGSTEKEVNSNDSDYSLRTANCQLRTSQWLREHVVAPFTEFTSRERQWLLILLFILFYKLADAFMGVMLNPFLLEIGFSKNDIATVVKLYGLIATLAGGFIGGWMVTRLGMMRSLWICGIGHGLTNLMMVWQAHVGADMQLLAVSISLENITGGMGTAAFVAYISALTNVRFTATQYALLSSFASFGRTLLSTPAGWCAKVMGWELFFTFAALLALPGLLVLRRLSIYSR